MGLYGNPNLSGREKLFQPDEVIVSKTDLAGKLVYGNNVFYRMAGLSEAECLGQPHNIIRHPDMPRSVFSLMWKGIQAGQEIFAYVNNRSKNGDNYWVFAHVTASRNIRGEVTGYHSNRRVPERRILEEKIKPLYQTLLGLERESASPKDGLDKANAHLEDLLKSSGKSFNQLMFSLGV